MIASPSETTRSSERVGLGSESPPGPLEIGSADLNALVSQWPVPVAIVGPKGRVWLWNRAAERQYGCPVSEVVGRAWREVVGDLAADAEPAVSPDLEAHEFQVVHRTRAGRTLNVRVTRSDLPGHDGTSGGCLYLLEERPDPRQLQARLERRVGQLSVLHQIGEALQSATDLDVILRAILVGATAGQGLSFNRAFLLLVHEDLREIQGRAAVGPSSPDDAARIWNYLRQTPSTLPEMLHNLEPLFQETDRDVNEVVRSLRAPLERDDLFLSRAASGRETILVGDGRERCSGRPVDPDLLERLGTRDFVAVPLFAWEHHVGLLLADNVFTGKPIEIDDIETLELLGVQAAMAIRRARLTAELEAQAEALEKAYHEVQESQRRLFRAERLSTIGQMAARVAHEIKNPLVAVGGFARDLLESTPQESPARFSLEIIVEEVRRLEDILGRILGYAADPPGRVQTLDLKEIAAEAFQFLQWELDHSAVEGHLIVDDDAPSARGDRDRIFQALFSLMHNAIQSMPAGGDLTLRIRGDSDWVEIDVGDTGIGIPEEAKPRVFEPFFTTKPTGTGLGLPIVSQIVGSHSGELRVESREGEGTHVLLRLPAHREDGRVEDHGG